ncbi:MAG: TolC family protein [Desulfomonile tiedjei]|nr:TolC family protein [Desulfomonile tiedjei]
MMFPLQGFHKKAALISLCLLVSLLASCRASLLNGFRPANHVQVTDSNSAMTLINHRVKPATTVTGKRFLTLEDCRTLALGNNLDLQAARLEELTQQAIQYSNRTRILPHFIFSGDLSERSNLRYSYSDVLGLEGAHPRYQQQNLGGAQPGVTSFSTGHERSTWYYVLETRWSPTDAALAYYVTKSSANETTKSRYHKLRIAQKLVELVDSSFFRLLALQEVLPLAENLFSLRKGMLYKTEQLLQDRLGKVEEYHRAEQRTSRAKRLLGKIRNDIENERNILASAMALSPDYCIDGGFRLEGALSRPRFSSELCELEMIAVRRRPEAYEAGLAHLSSVNDLKRTIVKYFPRVTGFWRHARDKDKFLYDPAWKEVGISIYFDLVEWLANVDESKASRIKSEKTEREMSAIALGITSQVRLAALKYFDGMDELENAESSVASLRKVLHAVEARVSMQDVERLMAEEARAELLEAKIMRIRALGEANATLAALQSSMGTNYQESMSDQ